VRKEASIGIAKSTRDRRDSGSKEEVVEGFAWPSVSQTLLDSTDHVLRRVSSCLYSDVR